MATAGDPVLPPTMRAIIRTDSKEVLSVQEVPTPTPTHGSVVVKILHVLADAHIQSILKGEMFFTYPLPSTPGTHAIGRIAATGPDTTSFSVDQLVLLEPFVRARDNGDIHILRGLWDGPTPATKKFTEENFRHGFYSEYVRSPLENCWALNEQKLCGELGYSTAELLSMNLSVLAYGGFRSADLVAGEKVVIAPATGWFSGAAVAAAVAMGASVVAAGRNLKVLERLRDTYGSNRVQIVQVKGDVEADMEAFKNCFGGAPVDAFVDISPPRANGATHVRSGLQALRPYGRAIIMGFVTDDVAVSYAHAVLNNLTIRGQYMYERSDVRGLIKLVESGAMKLGKSGGMEVVGQFKLEEFDQAGKMAEENPEAGKITLMSL
ncbi:hypothetical protein FQN54_000943 [Arachnomyces sp. PD_36]|nr:hypothetical protein FQN54_000943 [Arachnomyces sp. PD_36]